VEELKATYLFNENKLIQIYLSDLCLICKFKAIAWCHTGGFHLQFQTGPKKDRKGRKRQPTILKDI
jgi:hypothetical protein